MGAHLCGFCNSEPCECDRKRRRAPGPRLALIACRQDRARDWMHRSGLRPEDVVIITEPRQLHGLEGIRRNPERGLIAIYVEDWYRRSDRDEAELVALLRAHGFNGPFDGG